jgi:hypothetical protein
LVANIKKESADGPVKQKQIIIKGTVQQKLAWVKSGINRRLMIWAWAAWGLFYWPLKFK